MKKFWRYALLGTLVLGFAYTIYFLAQKSKQDPIVYETQQPSYKDIIKQSLATGSIKPREEIVIKPQVSGIIDDLFVEAGDKVAQGQLIARVKVIPNMVNLNNAQNRVETAQINYNTAKLEYERNEKLYKQGVIAIADFQAVEQRFKNAAAEVKAAQDNLDIVREGATKNSGQQSLTLVKSTVTGMVLDVPIKVGNQVIESNTFNEGTTIATVANMNDMIFEGLIDESEVGKIKPGMELIITIGAIENEEFRANLEYIAPKGTEKEGAIQFQVRAKVVLSEDVFIRAGYSANANIVLDRRDSVLSIPEALLQFEGENPFVEVETSKQTFEKRPVKLGLSDGITVEVLSGLKPDDKIKVWNQAQVEE